MLDALKYINCKVKKIYSSITLSNEVHIFLEKAYFKKQLGSKQKVLP